MKPLRFFWVRHAPPINPHDICYGADMDVDVSDIAALKKQAALIPAGAQWFVSPIFRAVKSAAALSDHHPDGNKIVFNIEPDLAEQSFGDWVGLPRALLPMQPGFAAYMADPVNEAPPGGESLTDQAKRVEPVIRKIIVANPQGGDICIVSHKGTNRSALHLTMGIALKDTLKISSDPLSVMAMEYDFIKWRLHHSNMKP